MQCAAHGFMHHFEIEAHVNTHTGIDWDNRNSGIHSNHTNSWISIETIEPQLAPQEVAVGVLG